nr:hypothetical protein OG296_03465 [Streptomyces sp. NBC_01001]
MGEGLGGLDQPPHLGGEAQVVRAHHRRTCGDVHPDLPPAAPGPCRKGGRDARRFPARPLLLAPVRLRGGRRPGGDLPAQGQAAVPRAGRWPLHVGTEVVLRHPVVVGDHPDLMAEAGRRGRRHLAGVPA